MVYDILVVCYNITIIYLTVLQSYSVLVFRVFHKQLRFIALNINFINCDFVSVSWVSRGMQIKPRDGIQHPADSQWNSWTRRMCLHTLCTVCNRVERISSKYNATYSIYMLVNTTVLSWSTKTEYYGNTIYGNYTYLYYCVREKRAKTMNT